jgi:polysaccharide deacetylase family protein (PEP-CTERM system associated)
MSSLTEAIPRGEEPKNSKRSPNQDAFHTYPYPVEPWTEFGSRVPHGVSRWHYFQRKFFIERIIGCLLLIMAAPIIVALWYLVRLHSKGGGFFRQTRVGYRGKNFEIIKLRTMYANAEADGKARWCVKGDPRITSLGRILRKTHLDELPQLINVARGEMALVGPRPERPCFVVHLKKEIEGYERRLSVVPGITGLAQINLPPDETIDDVRRKQYLDLLYIDQTNIWLDIRMVLATSIRMFGIPGDIVIRMLGLYRPIPASLAKQASKPGRRFTVDRSVDDEVAQRTPDAKVIERASLHVSQSAQAQSLPSFVPNAFTVDVEDYFHVSGFANCVSSRDWDSFPCRVQGNTERLLNLMQEKKVRGTFFVLGWVADRYPRLIQRIADEGHELGCHSYWHRLVYDMTPEEFLADLNRAREAIEQAAGTKVSLYRAPSFSITKSSLWALDILVEGGFQVDSSIFPMKRSRCGIPDSTSAIHRHRGIRQTIREYPPTVWQAGPVRVPIGGGYFRLAPKWVTQAAIDGARRAGVPAMFYIHPWEIDPEQPSVAGATLANRFRHSVGLHRTYEKLEWLLERNRFSAIGDVMRHFDVPHPLSTSTLVTERV